MTDNDREWIEWLENENNRLEIEIERLKAIIVKLQLANYFGKDL